MLTSGSIDLDGISRWIDSRPLLAPHLAERSDTRHHSRAEGSRSRRFRHGIRPTDYRSSFSADVQGGFRSCECRRERWKAQTRKGQNGSRQDDASVAACRGSRERWSCGCECYAACCAGYDECEWSRRCKFLPVFSIASAPSLTLCTSDLRSLEKHSSNMPTERKANLQRCGRRMRQHQFTTRDLSTKQRTLHALPMLLRGRSGRRIVDSCIFFRNVCRLKSHETPYCDSRRRSAALLQLHVATGVSSGTF